jgi:hypothetical protein
MLPQHHLLSNMVRVGFSERARTTFALFLQSPILLLEGSIFSTIDFYQLNSSCGSKCGSTPTKRGCVKDC